MWHFSGSKHTLTPPTYFQGVMTPSLPRIYVPGCQQPCKSNSLQFFAVCCIYGRLQLTGQLTMRFHASNTTAHLHSSSGKMCGCENRQSEVKIFVMDTIPAAGIVRSVDKNPSSCINKFCSIPFIVSHPHALQSSVLCYALSNTVNTCSSEYCLQIMYKLSLTLTLRCADMVDIINGTNCSRLDHSRSTDYILRILPKNVVKNQSSQHSDLCNIPQYCNICSIYFSVPEICTSYITGIKLTWPMARDRDSQWQNDRDPSDASLQSRLPGCFPLRKNWLVSVSLFFFASCLLSVLLKLISSSFDMYNVQLNYGDVNTG